MKLRDTEHLFVRSMSKLLRVTAVFLDADAANRHMAKTDDAVIAVFERKFGPSIILLANKHDKGETDRTAAEG